MLEVQQYLQAKVRVTGSCISMMTASSSLSTFAVWASLMLPVPISPAAENLTPSLVQLITTDSPNWERSLCKIHLRKKVFEMMHNLSRTIINSSDGQFNSSSDQHFTWQPSGTRQKASWSLQSSQSPGFRGVPEKWFFLFTKWTPTTQNKRCLNTTPGRGSSASSRSRRPSPGWGSRTWRWRCQPGPEPSRWWCHRSQHTWAEDCNRKCLQESKWFPT